MKKNIRLTSLILIAFMFLSVFNVFAAEYSDVTENTKTNEAVQILSSLDILKGYADGTFRPDNTITRAEFAAVVIRSLGLGNAAGGITGSTVFNDVVNNHWATGYINLAVNQGIINGYPDGTFKPENPVTYEEAVKMVVATLGYTPEAESIGGYPGGYLTIAAREGILSNISGGRMEQPATRSMVAIMAYNSLEVPIMEQIGFGTNTTFEKTARVLLDKLDVEKVEGKVTKIPGSDDRRLPAHQVEYTVLKRFETYGGKRVLRESDLVIKVDAGDTDAKDYLEQYTYAYIRNLDDSEAELIAIVERAGRNQTIIIDSTDIDEAKTNSITNGRLYYFTDKVKDKSSYVEIETSSSDLTYYYNGRKDSGMSISEFKTLVESGINGEIKLLDNNNDDVYDVIYVTDYKDIVVDYVSTNNYRIIAKDGSRIYLDVEDKDYTFVIMRNGKQASFSDIRAGDVLSICGVISDDDYLENGIVYIVKNSTIDGVITLVDTTNKIIEIDGEEFEYSFENSQARLGYEGTFYLNQQGKIIGMDRTSMALNMKFGFVTKMGLRSGISSAVELRMLTSDNTWNDYELSDKIQINGTYSSVKASSIFSDWNNYKPKSWGGENSGSLISVYTMVSYSINSSGKINKINFDLSSSNVTDNDFGYKDFSSYFRASIPQLGSGVITRDNTVIFDIGVDRKDLYSAGEDDITVGSHGMLLDGAHYTGSAFVEFDSSEAVAVMGFNMFGKLQYSVPVMIITGIQSAYEKGDTVTRLVGHSAQEKMTVDYVDSNVKIVDNTGFSIGNKLKVGDVVSLTKGSDNRARQVAILFRPSTAIRSGAVINPFNNNDGNNVVVFNTSDGNATKFMFGIARERTSSRLGIAFDERYNTVFTGATNHSTNVYTYDSLNYTNPRITVDTLSDIDNSRTIDKSPYSEDGDFVFIRVDNDTWVRDVVIVRRSHNFKDDNAEVVEDPIEDSEDAPPVGEAPPADETPAEDPPADETPAEDPPADETPAEDPPADETPAEDPPADETPAEAPPVDETPAEAPPADETPAEAPPADETPAEAPPVVEEPKIPVVEGTSEVIVSTAIKSVENGTSVTIEGKTYKSGYNAFADINEAVKVVDKNGTVLVYKDTYNTDVKIDKAITLKGIPSGMVYLNCSLDISANNVVIEGLNIIYNRTIKGESGIVLRENVDNDTLILKGVLFLDAKTGKDALAIKGGTKKVGMTTIEPPKTETDKADDSENIKDANDNVETETVKEEIEKPE